jgi:hypothetical protein
MMSSEVIFAPRTSILALKHGAQVAVGASHLKPIFVEPAGLSRFGQSYLNRDRTLSLINTSFVTVNSSHHSDIYLIHM